MTLRLSTGFRNAIMTNSNDNGKSWAEILKGGFIDVYKGVRPADSDAIESDAENFLFRVLKSGGDDIVAGSLTIGETYKITTFAAGDDFSNIGATNEVGNVFTATGDTPTTWTEGSVLQAVGLSFGDAVDGKISQPADDVWEGVPVNTGLASHFRYYSSTQDIGDGSGGDKVRIEGRVATYSGQMNMQSISIKEGVTQRIYEFNITMPE